MDLKLVFDWAWLPKLADGLVITVELTAACMAMGAMLGLLLALARVYGHSLPYWLASAYIQFFRGTPLLVQLIIIYYGLPTWGIKLPWFWAGILAMGLNTAAYQAEYIRGAIQAVKAGQMLAGRSLGMTKWQTIRYVILPQALRLVIPPWSNELIYMLKYSSIVYLVTGMDLMGVARTIAAKNFRYFEVFIVVALIYLTMVLLLTFALRWMERRLSVPGLGTMR